MDKMKFDFSGYATKFDVKCSDGRTIKDSAFKHNDGLIVPLVWQHDHNDPTNVIGHAMLEYREGDGMYAYGSFNDTSKGEHSKLLVQHKDIDSLSIYANQLKQAVNDVIHGCIKEVSLVLSGANPGAMIDFVELAHSDEGVTFSDTEATIYHSDSVLDIKGGEIEIKHAENGTGDKTLEEIFHTFSEEQLEAVYAFVGLIAEDKKDPKNMKQSEGDDEDDLKHSKGGQGSMKTGKTRLFDGTDAVAVGSVLTHGNISDILELSRNNSGRFMEEVAKYVKHDDKLNEAYLAHAGTYGIDDIEVLFPEARNVMTQPEFDKRRTEWVSDFMGAVSKKPFARIRSMYADIKKDTARAKGYVKGNEKIEEVIELMKRTTDPTLVYKKQKLDKQDIIAITDFDVVVWLKMEMRLMLEEEIARAFLVGDGREVDDDDKIDESKIRPIYKDASVYNHRAQLASDSTGLDQLEEIVKSRKYYKGSGKPTLYTTIDAVTDWKLLKNTTTGEYRFRSVAEIANFIGVKKIVEVEVMEGLDYNGYDLIGIMVNPRDYTTGANSGGRIGMYNAFDIDFNQEKYLMESNISGALTKIRSSVTIEKAQAAG